MAINVKSSVHLSAGDRIDLLLPGIKWSGDSPIHRSYSRSTDYDYKLDGKLVTKSLAIQHNVTDALTFLKGLPITLSWLVTVTEFVQLYLATVHRPYHQPTKTATHTETNPDSGNVYVPVARKGELMVLLRSWTLEYGNPDVRDEVSYRIRFVLASTKKQEDMVADTDLAVFLAADQTQAAEKLVAATPQKVRESIFDFTPEVRERKPKARVKVLAGEDDF